MLYRAVLGDTAFEQLPPVLRAFHDPVGKVSAYGTVRVERGASWLSRRVADLMGLPPAGERLPLRLEVQPYGGHERWTRHFGTFLFQTVQWEQAGQLIEASGPMRFALRLWTGPRGLHFQLKRAWLGPIPLPLTHVLRIDAESVADPDAGSWQIDVRIQARWLGRLVRYSGQITPDQS